MFFFARMADEWIASALDHSSGSEPNMISILLEQDITREQLKGLVLDFLIGGVDTVRSVAV